MKGIHNAIDGWRYDWDSRGWKVKRKRFQAMLTECFQMLELCQEENKGNGGSVMQKDTLVNLTQGDLGEPASRLVIKLDLESKSKSVISALPDL